MWRWDQQEPFGVNVPDENPSGLGAFDLPLRLPGQYYDKETNLHYNYFRDCYDPGTGRFCQPDPIGLDGGDLSLYVYAANNPLSFTDPEGLQALPFPRPSIPGFPSSPLSRPKKPADPISEAHDPSKPGGNVIPFPTPKPKEDEVCPAPGDADDNFCKRQQESLNNRKKLLLKMASTGFKLTPQQITGFNAEVRAHNLRCPKFPVDPIGPTSIK